MARRLIDWRTINQEKIKRGRSWIFAELKAGRFPQPVVRGSGSNLWDESDVDRWLEEFAANSGTGGTSRTVTAKVSAAKRVSA